MTRTRWVDVQVPVVLPSGGIGVGPIFAAIAGAVVFALLVLLLVVFAEPTPRHTPTTTCEPFCSQYNPTTTVLVAPQGDRGAA